MSDLELLRDQVEQISARLAELLQQRAEIVVRIGREKQRLGLPLRDSEREDALLGRLAKRHPGVLSPERLRRVFCVVVAAGLEQVVEELKREREP